MTKRKRSSQSNTQTHRILCVTNFPDYLSSKDLQSYFEELGKVEKILMFYDKESRAKAYIEFSEDLAPEKALKFNRASIESERIRLRFILPQDRDVVFSQVPKDLTEETLKNDYLSEIGEVEEVERVSETAFRVRFATIQGARDAIDFNGADIEGQVVDVVQLRLSAQDLQKIMLGDDDVEVKEPEKKRQKKQGGKKSKKQKSS